MTDEFKAASVIHLATHALGATDELEPHVVISDDAGCDAPLLMKHIQEMDIRARLVYLSACGSAVGATSTGEGLKSVARAFLLAGAQCVVATLWPVADHEAMRFTKLFYDGLEGGAQPSAALLAAKQASSAAGVGLRTSAAFEVFGDGSRASTADEILADLSRRVGYTS